MAYTGDNVKLMSRIRMALRMSSTSFDVDEIVPLLDACKADLAVAGIDADFTNPLMQHAAVLYCKANFGYSADSEKFQKAYDALKVSLSLTSTFTTTSEE